MELFATPRSSKQLIVQNRDLDKVMNNDRTKGGTIVATAQRSFSEVTEELVEKEAYICRNCNKPYRIEDAKNNKLCFRTMNELLREGFAP